ncbi:MAG: extracellular solute-binding protein [Thermomicrobiales bacterium]
MFKKLESRRSILKTGAGLIVAGSVLGQGSAFAQSTPSATPAVAGGSGKLTVYSGQHEDLVKAFAGAFQKESGITIEIRSGGDSDLANQIIEEGDKTNADIFITEEPGPAGTLDAKDLLAPIDAASLAKTDKRFNPENGHWLAYGARSRAIFYNPDLIAENALPKSIFDLPNEEWKGKYAYAPSGAFTSTVTYMVNTDGEEKTLDWLKGVAATGENLLKNGAIRDAVEAGQFAFGLSNHYYWYVLAKEKGGADKLTSKVHFMKGQDPGGLVFASAVAVLKASKNQDAAQQFVSWLADAKGGQAVLAANSPQYPLAPGVESSYDLPPFSELDPPIFDQGSLKDSDKAVQLIVDAGLI